MFYIDNTFIYVISKCFFERRAEFSRVYYMPYLSAPWTYAIISFLEKADLNLGIISQVCKFHRHRLVLGISKMDMN